MFKTILLLSLLGLVPIIMSIGIRSIDKFTRFKKFPYWAKQLIIGLLMGGASIIGSEFGVKTDTGAIINIRDAAPICAGLIFGAPAGIIAGLIGGVERFLSVMWGGGTFTRWACSISTVFAGIFAAIIRHTIFDGHHGRWYYGIVAGVFVEVFHMLMVFLTNMSNVKQAYSVVHLCAFPMIIANALVIGVAMIIIAILWEEPLFDKEKPRTIKNKVQSGLAVAIVLALSVVEILTYSVFDHSSETSTNELIQTNIDDIVNSVNTETNDRLLNICRVVDQSISGVTKEDDIKKILKDIVKNGSASVINVIDANNLVTISTDDSYIGWNMADDPKSKEFTILNSDGKTFEFIQDYQLDYMYPNRYMKYAAIKYQNDFGGFIQVGINEQYFTESIDGAVEGIASNRHIGQSGIIMIANKDGKVLSSGLSTSLKTIEVDNIVHNELMTLEASSTIFPFIDEDVYYYAVAVEGYHIIGTLGVSEADLDKNVSVSLTFFIEFFIFFVMYITIYQILKKVFLSKIVKVSKSLQEITAGNLNTVVDERSSFELNSLSNDINSTVTTLKDYISKEAQKMESELMFAKNIQHSALPNTFPPFPHVNEFDIYASMDTAKEVGGDFYDFFMFDSTHLAFLIADVSGKGVPAAMFMMQSKTILKSLIESGLEIGPAITLANQKLCEGNEAQMFVTAWLGILDIKTGIIKYSNAGHNPPIIGHADGTFEYLKGKVNLVLAAMDIVRYQTQEMKLEPGDQIYLYTDGVTEATNINKELYGEDRLLNFISSQKDLNETDLCKAIKANVDEFVGEAEQADDITMVSLQFHGQRNIRRISVEATIPNVAKVIELADNFLEENECPMRINSQVDIAIDEIVSNIVYYAYPEGGKGIVNVIAEISKDKDLLTMTFEDQGIAYNPLEKDDPDITLSAQERAIGGLGIFMVKKSMDDMTYRRINGRNCLTIKKKLK